MDHAEPAVAGDLEGRAARWREPGGGHPAPSLRARSGAGSLRGWLTGELPQPPLSRRSALSERGFPTAAPNP